MTYSALAWCMILCCVQWQKVSAFPSVLPPSRRSHRHARRRPCSTRRFQQHQQQQVPSVLEETDPSPATLSVWNELLSRFQGDFDNYRQVCADYEQGLLPRAGGGHEHIHCCLVPVDHDTRLAAFYFDGTPGAVFRFRYYQLVPHNETAVDTVLYTLHPALEAQLRQCPDPLQWPDIFHAFDETTQDDPRIAILPRCEVRWSFTRDPVQHAYLVNGPSSSSSNSRLQQGIHAVMVHGPALIESQMLPGQQILIKDQLSLWPQDLWIHDRGYDKDGNFVYGNQRGVPYRMERVADITVSSQDKSKRRRTVTQPSLAWTLGPEHRSPEEYELLMEAVGGSTIPERKR